jgi:hypothetical protein
LGLLEVGLRLWQRLVIPYGLCAVGCLQYFPQQPFWCLLKLVHLLQSLLMLMVHLLFLLLLL